jgi:hypothetical protein
MVCDLFMLVFLAPVFFALGPLFDRDGAEKDGVGVRLITAQTHQLTQGESDKFVLCFCGVINGLGTCIFVFYFCRVFFSSIVFVFFLIF